MAVTKNICRASEEARALDFEISFAFQPIVDMRNQRIFGYEALVRGTDGAPAQAVLSRLTEENRYVFDQTARTKAIALASRLFPQARDCRLSLNILPNAVYEPERCIRSTLHAARLNNFPYTALMFEMTEQERVADMDQLQKVITHYNILGFTTAIDDFGAGFAGLGFLAQFTPNMIKLDRELVRHIDQSPVRQAILTGILDTTKELDIAVVAEGVERWEELVYLLGRGVKYFQGYLFARPGFEHLPQVDLDALQLNDNCGSAMPMLEAA
jgi:EAL domain-containing protein (putative c-di-GMP-specific phosphodiesterase class I)